MIRLVYDIVTLSADFPRRVCSRISQVTRGKVIAYGRLARGLKSPLRAVGAAMTMTMTVPQENNATFEAWIRLVIQPRAMPVQ